MDERTIDGVHVISLKDLRQVQTEPIFWASRQRNDLRMSRTGEGITRQMLAVRASARKLQVLRLYQNLEEFLLAPTEKPAAPYLPAHQNFLYLYIELVGWIDSWRSHNWLARGGGASDLPEYRPDPYRIAAENQQQK